MDPLVSIVVVNWNGMPHLQPCIESLLAQDYLNVEIIVVDNASSDRSGDYLGSLGERVRTVRTRCNLGFAGGCNVGISLARGDLIATLNNDAQASRTWISAMVKALDGRTDVGMVASKMLLEPERSMIDSAGISLDRVGIAWDRHGGAPCEMAGQPSEVFGPCGGAALYRKSMLGDIGTFDEDFFMYLEDVDLAWRAQLAGWRCVYAPDAVVYHRHSASSGENSPFKRFHLSRNKVWVIAKNYSSPEVFLYLPAIVAFDLAALVSSAFFVAGRESTVDYSFATLLGRISGLLTIGTALRKRRDVQPTRRVPRWRVLARMESAVRPWQIHRRYAHVLARATRQGPDR